MRLSLLQAYSPTDVFLQQQRKRPGNPGRTYTQARAEPTSSHGFG